VASLENVLQQHTTVFHERLGTLKGFEAKILVDPSAKPKYCKAHVIPYALREKVKELTRLVNEGTLEPIAIEVSLGFTNSYCIETRQSQC